MKKSLLICFCMINYHCFGMSTVVNFILSSMPPVSESSSPTTTRSNDPESWAELLENGKYDEGIRLLKKAPSADVNSYALYYLIKSSLPIRQLERILGDFSFRFSESNFLSGMQTALRRGDLTRYDLLEEYSTLSLKYKLELVVVGRIDAAAGNPKVMRWLLRRGKEAYAKIALEENHSKKDLEFYDKMWNISRRLKSSRSAWIWDNRQGKLVKRGTKMHTLPLHAAADCRSKDNVILLLQHGADVNATDHDGETAEQIAKRRKAYEIVRIIDLFKQWKSSVFTMQPARELVGLIRDCPALASCYLKDRGGNTLLHRATYEKEYLLIDALIDANRDLLLERNNEGDIPMVIWTAGPESLSTSNKPSIEHKAS